jgi:hypothetical protein
MMNASLDTDPADRHPVKGLQKDNRQVSEPPIQISEQTTWMLAVRDRRDRVAYAALFDHFAPRLKGFIMRSGTGSGMAEELFRMSC